MSLFDFVKNLLGGSDIVGQATTLAGDAVQQAGLGALAGAIPEGLATDLLAGDLAGAATGIAGDLVGQELGAAGEVVSQAGDLLSQFGR